MSTTPSTPAPGSQGIADRVMAGWSLFWFTPADASLLGVIRICIGLLVLYVHLVYSLDVQAYFGEHAWIDLPIVNAQRLEEEQPAPTLDWWEPEYDEENEFAPPPTVRKGHAVWSLWFHVTDPAAIERIYLVMLGVMVLFTLGLWTRVTAVLTWLAFLSCVHRVPQLVYGMDIVIGIVLFYLMLGPCGAALSLDRLLANLRARRSNPTVEIRAVHSAGANFCLRLMQVHLAFIYLISGLCKLQGPAWWNGTAVWNTIINYELSLVRYPWYADALRSLIQNRWVGELLVTAGTVYALVVEIGFPFLVWHGKLRWLMIAAAMVMHLGIAVFMGLLPFSLSMMILVLCFIPPEQVGPIGSWLVRAIRENAPWSRSGHAASTNVVEPVSAVGGADQKDSVR
ncbi:MAG: HTTM domain-containing protein [Planctomycetes bacterium]|nr:HTTM domain-containing protein [Planctomycetota bacterium]